jgi:hypothetical protein
MKSLIKILTLFAFAVPALAQQCTSQNFGFSTTFYHCSNGLSGTSQNFGIGQPSTTSTTDSRAPARTSGSTQPITTLTTLQTFLDFIEPLTDASTINKLAIKAALEPHTNSWSTAGESYTSSLK